MFRTGFAQRLLGRKKKPEKPEFFVFGLGNPGSQYSHTRHNAGFDVLDILAQRANARFSVSHSAGRCTTVDIAGRGVMLIKPQKFMNASGEVVRDFVREYGIPMDRLIVVYDDVDLALGRIRVRAQGSAGSHKGMKSIIYLLCRDDFPRVRVGIGKNDCDIADYVLSGYSEADMKTAFAGYTLAADAVTALISEGVAAAQAKYN